MKMDTSLVLKQGMTKFIKSRVLVQQDVTYDNT